MAVLHRATIVPSKAELVQAWLPSRPWAPVGPIKSGASYRLDDPAGAVGMEGFLLTTSNGHTVHIPLSYRGEPLKAADEHLIGTMEHSVLGPRWVYDGCHDPVWAAALISVITTGGTQAEELVDVGGSFERRDPQVTLRGSGRPGTTVREIHLRRVSEGDSTTTIVGDHAVLVVVRRVGVDPGLAQHLTATWSGGHLGVPLAGLSWT